MSKEKKEEKKEDSINMISGEEKDIHYDKEFATLNLELCSDKGCPVIEFSGKKKDAKDGEWEDFFTLHIGEALDLKAMIDNALLHYTMDKELFDEDEEEEMDRLQEEDDDTQEEDTEVKK